MAALTLYVQRNRSGHGARTTSGVMHSLSILQHYERRTLEVRWLPGRGPGRNEETHTALGHLFLDCSARLRRRPPGVLIVASCG
jgi:hypothetical protein